MAGSERRGRRVLHVSQPTDAGVARCVATLAADHVARGWDCVVACVGSSPLASAVRAVGAVHRGWRAGRSPVPRLRELEALRRVVEAVDPDVVHLHSAKAGLVGRLVVRGRLPTVFQPHAWSFHATAGAAAQAAVAWERLAARWTDVIVCVSEGERREGLKAGIAADIRVVHNGVDLRRYARADDRSRTEIRRELGLPPDARIAITPGRVCEQKGQDILLRGWGLVRRVCPDALLVLVGDGPLQGRLERSADASVLFAGNRPDVTRWLAAADVVVLPSRWEGLSLSMLEAMAIGRAVVVTEVAGSELVREGAGAIVPVGDVGALAREVIRRLRDGALSATEGAVARRIVESGFDVSRMTDGVAGVYDGIIGAGAAPRAA